MQGEREKRERGGGVCKQSWSGTRLQDQLSVHRRDGILESGQLAGVRLRKEVRAGPCGAGVRARGGCERRWRGRGEGGLGNCEELCGKRERPLLLSPMSCPLFT